MPELALVSRGFVQLIVAGEDQQSEARLGAPRTRQRQPVPEKVDRRRDTREQKCQLYGQ